MSDGIPRRSLIVALIVGTILNLINQGDALLGNEPVNWSRLILTYMVPYAVSTYGAVTALLGSSKANRDSD
ncbi:MAG: nitrate/nitrite transporter NrtS [Gammaproteobacteria bacterium]